jgi:hypothetical protein
MTPIEIIKYNIQNNIKHSLYDETLRLNKIYKQLIAGDGIEELLKQFVMREDETMFNQRVNLTHHIVEPVSESIMNPFKKLSRINNIINSFVSNYGDDKLNKLKNSLEKYHGNSSLIDYLTDYLCDKSFIDPNGFICTEFTGIEVEASGKFSGVPQPYPIFYGSESIMNYVYENNKLKWCIVKLNFDVKLKNGTQKKADRYIMYMPDSAIEITEIYIEEGVSLIGDQLIYNQTGETFELFQLNNNRYFKVQTYEHKSKEIPLTQIGYIKHKTKDGLFVSPIHPAIPYYKKTIKTVSEFDLTMSLHAFPQKLEYAARCQGTKSHPCDSGRLLDGTICGECKGTGHITHTSAQDKITIRLPKNKEDMFELGKLIEYKYPPIDLLKFQDEQIEKLEAKVKKSVFNSDVFEKNTIAQTATEVTNNYQSVYDTLRPYANNISRLYKHISTVSAYYHDITDITVTHKFPRDFKFKTVQELLFDLKTANDSGAPGYIKKEISNDIAVIQFEDKPEELNRIRVKKDFFPFQDKTETEIIYIISNGLTSQYNKVLWANFDNIFEELESEFVMPSFYLFERQKQKDLIKAKVDVLISELEQVNTTNVNVFKSIDDQIGSSQG